MSRLRIPAAQRPALVITVLVALVGPLFVASYSLAMGDPVPHDVPVGVVGTAGDADAVGRALDARDSGVFLVSAYDNGAAARTALSRQEIYAVVEPDADPPTVLISSASGESVARLMAERAVALTARLGAEPRLVDMHPLAPGDPYGLVLFYLALGATILGFVGAIQTRVNAGHMSLWGELGWDVGRSAVVALAMTLVIGPVLGDGVQLLARRDRGAVGAASDVDHVRGGLQPVLRRGGRA